MMLDAIHASAAGPLPDARRRSCLDGKVASGRDRDLPETAVCFDVLERFGA